MDAARVDAYRVSDPQGALWEYDPDVPTGYSPWRKVAVLATGHGLEPERPEWKKVPGPAPKDTNPKSAFGDAKPPLGMIPAAALVEIGFAMVGGDKKYGRRNWLKDPVSASTYFHALLRHLFLWWGGQDMDQSGAHHLGHVASNAAILIDARANNVLVDDRPPVADHLAEYMAKRAKEFNKVNGKETPEHV